MPKHYCVHLNFHPLLHFYSGFKRISKRNTIVNLLQWIWLFIRKKPFLKKQKWQKIPQEEIYIMNSPICLTYIKFVIKILLTRKSPGWDVCTSIIVDLIKYLKDKSYQFYTNSSRKWKRENISQLIQWSQYQPDTKTR